MNKRLPAWRFAPVSGSAAVSGLCTRHIFGSEPGSGREPQSQTSLLLPVDIDDKSEPYAAQSDMGSRHCFAAFIVFVTDNTFAVILPGQSINEAGGGEYLVTLRDDVAFSDGTALSAPPPMLVYSFGQTEPQQKRYRQLHTSVESVTEVESAAPSG